MKKYLVHLFLVIIVGSVLRLAYLDFAPPSLNWDEVSHGYNAYSILKTGTDEWGKFPIFNFRAYGDYPTPLNLYLTIPFIMLLGLTEVAIRLPHALLGVLTIISVYFLTWGITKRRDVSLLSSLLVAIEPWYVFTSRFVLQSNLSVFLMTTSAAFFVNRDKSKYFFPSSMFLLILTLFSYHTTRIFSPLLLIAILLIYKDSIFKLFKANSLKLFSWFIFVIVFIATTVVIFSSPDSRARSGVLFLVDQGAVNRIIEKRNSSELSAAATRLFYNRPTYFITQFAKNYISYFSPEFLFLKGGTQYQFSLPDRGLMYVINLPFFYLGLFLVFAFAIKNKNYRLLLAWIIISPIPASLTNESHAVLRATTMLPLPQIFTSLGIYFVFDQLVAKKKTLALMVYITLLGVMTISYLNNYFTNYRTNYSWSWQYGYKEAVNYVNENYMNYDKIIITKKYGEPHEYFLFFMNWDPKKYKDSLEVIRYGKSNWFWVDRIDKLYFVNDWDIPKEEFENWKLESGETFSCSKEKCLIVTSPGNYPKGLTKLKDIYFLDGKSAFEIYEN